MTAYKIYLASGLILTLLLSGCATQGTLIWEHPEQHDRTQLTKDRDECEKIVNRIIFDLEPLPAPFLFGPRRRGSALLLNESAFNFPMINRLSLYHSCMEAKGWQQRYKVEPTDTP
jgi:hypothetical protein